MSDENQPDQPPALPADTAQTSPDAVRIGRRTFIRDAALALGGGVAGVQSMAGNRHDGSLGMTATGAAIGAASMVAFGHVIKAGDQDKDKSR